MNIPSEVAGQVRVAVLFSGGIDSSIIAAIVDRILPPKEAVDLLNVAFAKETNDFNSVPDRITGLESYEVLKRLNPSRPWNFVSINVRHQEYQSAKYHVRQLICPCDTVMDLSIAMALWFAARGIGVLEKGKQVEYKSTAKVILSGLGADELLAGYSRHRRIFHQSGISGLVAELNLELVRLGIRNLGRDDRVFSDHGREARFPFLDESVVAWMTAIPLDLRFNLLLPRGEGEKELLRKLAIWLGFPQSLAFTPKRAIQFGARTAKIDGVSASGTERLSFDE